MSLHDYYDENTGANFIPPGEHIVRIVNSRAFVSTNKGTSGVEFLMRNAKKQEIKHTFWLTEDSIKILSFFAKIHCGLSDEEMRHYNENNPASHRVLIGKYLKVTVEKVASYKDSAKKFSEITQFERYEGPESGNIAAEEPQDEPQPVAADDGYPKDEDIPF